MACLPHSCHSVSSIGLFTASVEPSSYPGESDEMRSVIKQLTASSIFTDPTVRQAGLDLQAHVGVELSGASCTAMRTRMRNLLGVMDCVLCNQVKMLTKLILFFVVSHSKYFKILRIVLALRLPPLPRSNDSSPPPPPALLLLRLLLKYSTSPHTCQHSHHRTPVCHPHSVNCTVK